MNAHVKWVKDYAEANGLTLKEGWFAGDRTLTLREPPTELYPEGRLVHIAISSATYDAAATYERMRGKIQLSPNRG